MGYGAVIEDGGVDEGGEDVGVRRKVSVRVYLSRSRAVIMACRNSRSDVSHPSLPASS